jgi:hypothetical protein
MKKTAFLSVTIIILLAAGSLFLYSCGKDGPMAPSAGGGEDGVLGAAALLLSSDIIITNATDDQSVPDAAYDGINDKYLVVWEDYRDKNGKGADIYGVLVNATTNSVEGGTEFIISDDASTQNQLSPRVAFDHINGKYLVVWADMRNNYGQIYGQFVNSTGGLDGSNFYISEHSSCDEYFTDGTWEHYYCTILHDSLLRNLFLLCRCLVYRKFYCCRCYRLRGGEPPIQEPADSLRGL